MSELDKLQRALHHILAPEEFNFHPICPSCDTELSEDVLPKDTEGTSMFVTLCCPVCGTEFLPCTEDQPPYKSNTNQESIATTNYTRPQRLGRIEYAPARPRASESNNTSDTDDNS